MNVEHKRREQEAYRVLARLARPPGDAHGVLGDARAVAVRRRPAERERGRRGRGGEREVGGRVGRGGRHRETHRLRDPRALHVLEQRAHSAHIWRDGTHIWDIQEIYL